MIRESHHAMSTDPGLSAHRETKGGAGHKERAGHPVKQPGAEGRDPLAHKRVEMESVRKDLDAVTAQMIEATQHQEWERYDALRRAFDEKLNCYNGDQWR